MLSRTLASQSLRRSLFASCSALNSARRLPNYVRLNSSAAKQSPSGGEPKVGSRKGASLDPWVPPILTYDQVKPKTEQPSPVHSDVCHFDHARLTMCQDSYLIDVREPDEVIQGSIPSSVNIPLSVLPGSLSMNEGDFQTKFGFKKPKRHQEIIFYCRSGVRAATAGDIAMKNGYKKLVSQASTPHVPLTHNPVRLYNYKGSWLEWVQKEGHKVGTS